MKREKLAKGPISWMTQNSVAANLIMVALIVGGIIMSFTIKREVFPSAELDMVLVSVPYPGASPEEVEHGIILAIEESVRSIDNVKEVKGYATEGSGQVFIILESGANKNKITADIKNQIDRITTFPENAERPIVSAPAVKREAIWLVLYGDQEENVLFEIGEQVRDQLLSHEQISYVEVEGVRPLEISVEIPQDALRTYNLTLQQVSNQIRQTALELPAGALKTKGGEVMLRTAERRNSGTEFENIPVVINGSGTPVTLGSIASINDGFSETDVFAQFEGKPCVFIKVFSVGDQSPTNVAQAAKSIAVSLNKTLPSGISAATWLDMSDLYQQRLDLMLKNAALGLILVLIILGLFLEPRLAFWVTMGIPISFMGSFIFLPAAGISLNMISMFAFIVTLGMVVDDAIVVGENIFRYKQEGMSALKASIKGAQEMAMPVFFSIATTIAAFSPLMFIPGMRGQFMLAIPVVTIIVLLISLVESFFVLPAHLAHVKNTDLEQTLWAFVKSPLLPKTHTGILKVFDTILSIIIFPLVLWMRLAALFIIPFCKIQKPFSTSFQKFTINNFGPIVRATLRHKGITICVGIAIALSSCGIMLGGHVKVIDFPKEESDWVFVNASLPYGAPIEETEILNQKLIDAAHRVINNHSDGKTNDKVSKGIFSIIGSGTIRGSKTTGTHVTKVGAILVPSDQRDFGSFQFAQEWREELGEVPGLDTIKFDATTGHGETPPIDISLSHRDPAILEAAAIDLADYLNSIKGVVDVDNGIERGKPQLDFTVSKDGQAAGFTSANIATQIRNAFYGSEALRQQRGRNEIRVMVKFPRSERESIDNVEQMILQTPTMGEMPLRYAANIKYGRAYTAIKRIDGKRSLGINAEVVEGKANAQEVTKQLYKEYAPSLRSKYPGILIEPGGRQKATSEFIDFLKYGYSMALIIMFILIAIPLRSYLQPFFVVMMAIPFGVVGAIWGHLVMGISWSMISWMGLVALSGVVVNDSLVLVTAANRFREKGMTPFKAVENASIQRFRPILLTSLTTFGGLMPMILETSVQARILIPMAVSLGFGVIFATGIILILVPSLYLTIEIPRDWWRLKNEPLDNLHANTALEPILTEKSDFGDNSNTRDQ